MKKLILVLLLLLLLSTCSTPDQKPPNPPPIKDVCYAQELGEYVREGNGIVSQNSFQKDQDSVLVPPHLRLILYREKYPEPDMVLDHGIKIMPFTPGNLLALLKQYQAYCDTVTAYETYYNRYFDLKKNIEVNDTTIMKRSGLPVTFIGFGDWLENVKLKGSN